MKENSGEDNILKFPKKINPEDSIPKGEQKEPSEEDLEGVIDLRKIIDERNKSGEGRLDGGAFYEYQRKKIESKVFLEVFNELEKILLDTPLTESESAQVAKYKEEIKTTYSDDKIRDWFLSTIREEREKDKPFWLAMILEATNRRIFI